MIQDVQFIFHVKILFLCILVHIFFPNKENYFIFQVPDNFRIVVQATYREFSKAVVANKDTEPSWKKAIYKVIARMDDVLPEYFKSPNWMDQLGDM